MSKIKVIPDAVHRLDRHIIQVAGTCNGKWFAVRAADDGSDGPMIIGPEWVEWVPQSTGRKYDPWRTGFKEIKEPLVHKIGEKVAAWLTERGQPTRYTARRMYPGPASRNTA